MKQLILPGGTAVTRHGCDKCGRGVDRIVFEPRPGRGESQQLTGAVAEDIWDVLEEECRRVEAARR